MLYKISYLRIYFISIIGYVIPKWIVVQEILQMRVLNVCIQLASLLSTLAIIKGKNYAFEKWDQFTLNTIEYRIEYYPDKVFCHFPIQFHKKICQIQMWIQSIFSVTAKALFELSNFVAMFRFFLSVKSDFTNNFPTFMQMYPAGLCLWWWKWLSRQFWWKRLFETLQWNSTILLWIRNALLVSCQDLQWCYRLFWRVRWI